MIKKDYNKLIKLVELNKQVKFTKLVINTFKNRPRCSVRLQKTELN